KVPNWTPEDRALVRKREKKREKKSHKARSKPSLAKDGKGGERQQGQSSAAASTAGARDHKARNKNPKRVAAAAAAVAVVTADAETAANGITEVPLKSVNVNDAAEPPRPVSRVRVFDPELDNVLLRSLLYEEEYTHVLSKHPPAKKARWRPKAGSSPRPAAAGAQGPDGGEDAAGLTTGTYLGEDGGAAGVAEDRKGSRPFAKQRLGALADHLPLSPRAGQRPKHYAYCDKRRLGPPFAGPVGPGQVMDGTAVSFGARAMGPFRAGLAATMVEVGLVPDEVAAEAGYSELVEAEAALAREAEKAAGAGGGVGGGVAEEGVGSSVFGCASDDWRSRVPSDFRIGTPDGRSHPAARAGETQAPRSGKAPAGANRPESSKSVNGRPSAGARDEPRTSNGHGGGGGGVGRTGDHMEVEEDVRKGSRGSGVSEREQGGGSGSGSGPIHNRRASPPPSGGLEGGAGAGGGGGRARPERDEAHSAGKARSASGDRDRPPPLGKKDPQRKENRMWNLKHMRATQEGKQEACAYCRLQPDGALMVCSSQELVKMHSFCLPCLKKKDGIEKSDIVGGGIK
ncbi:unnamed protein product, partial [Hapterophycus canaliculatus]